MDIQKEILGNINTRYVLLKKDDKYYIIDIKTRALVAVDNPIINYEELIKAMLNREVKVYDNVKSLPSPVEHSVRSKPNSIKIFIKKIYNELGAETGVIITAITPTSINVYNKKSIEKIMENYAYNVLYPYEGLNIYSNTYDDTASITVIKGINTLPSQNIDAQEIFDW